MLIHLPGPLCIPLLPAAMRVTSCCASHTNGGTRLGLYLQFLDPSFKPWPSCHCCQCPWSRDEDLL